MKWKNCKKTLTGNSKTFLVLPLVDDSALEMNKNQALRLFTKGTWPPKKQEKDENTRPLTATLEKPQLLDIRLMSKIDMSLLRKEYLSITNLCRVPLTTINYTKPRRKTAILERRRPVSNLPVAISNIEKSRQIKKAGSTSEDSWEEESSHSSRSSSRKIKLKSQIRPPAIITPKKLEPTDEINNNLKPIRKRATNAEKIETLESTKQLPTPCTTCGRPDLPERFHSHPTTPLKPIKKAEVKVPTKNTVQKPMAMKYKSKLDAKVEERKNSLPAQKLMHTPPHISSAGDNKLNSAKAGPRTLTCYLCGREFGTASLPLHEPKCLEKWERENASLPAHLRKKAPAKPDQALTKQEWNKLAWEASQAALAPCLNCGRTFYPDRLLVHQRSCKAVQRLVNPSMKSKPTAPELLAGAPPSAQCSVCGKLFGTKSIKIHEPQCLKKWHIRNDHLPADQQEPMANRKDAIPVTPSNPPISAKKPEVRSPTERKPQIVPCYLCGRLFGVLSINIHEPQCLKKWRIENDKLPEHKRRQEPQRPEIKLTQDGKVDIKATEEANWLCHLAQLVPCQHCKRTFNPDRVDVHERNCKGPT